MVVVRDGDDSLCFIGDTEGTEFHFEGVVVHGFGEAWPQGSPYVLCDSDDLLGVHVFHGVGVFMYKGVSPLRRLILDVF